MVFIRGRQICGCCLSHISAYVCTDPFSLEDMCTPMNMWISLDMEVQEQHMAMMDDQLLIES
jgi:hypothetical protein